MPHKTLRDARVARGWTQEQLAKKSGVDQRVISKIERNKTDDPRNATVQALEEALSLKRGTLIFGAEALAS